MEQASLTACLPFLLIEIMPLEPHSPTGQVQYPSLSYYSFSLESNCIPPFSKLNTVTLCEKKHPRYQTGDWAPAQTLLTSGQSYFCSPNPNFQRVKSSQCTPQTSFCSNFIYTVSFLGKMFAVQATRVLSSKPLTSPQFFKVLPSVYPYPALSP